MPASSVLWSTLPMEADPVGYVQKEFEWVIHREAVQIRQRIRFSVLLLTSVTHELALV